MQTRAITVALVEDDAEIRNRFARVLHDAHALRLLFACATASEMQAWLENNPVDVLLVDLGLPDANGLEVIAYANRRQPSCDVMVITMFGDEANMLRAFEAGARGYLLKDGTEADLAAHVLSLHAGGSPMSPIIARQLLRRLDVVAAASPVPPAQKVIVASPLSNRESAVLDLLARGFTYQETAEQLGIGAATVQSHVKNIYSKLAVHSKTEAVFEARALGILAR
jgi:DNA-binding NarL/FixJ family response regulator